MGQVADFFGDIWNQIVVIMSTGHNWLLDLIDIAIVTFIIYKAVQFMRETRAVQLIKGIFILVIAYFAAGWLRLGALYWIMQMVFSYGIVVIFVLFQPELRSALERMGRGNIKNIGKSTSAAEIYERFSCMIDSVCKACHIMQHGKVGALIVLEQNTMLGEITQTGTIIDSAASRELICNVFFPNSPLHDGALIIREDRLYAAGCILPLTQNKNIDSNLGTRHRAAIGVTEVSDAVVVIVSEETGMISIAYNGAIERNFNQITLKEKLEEYIMGAANDQINKKGFLGLFNKGGKKNEE